MTIARQVELLSRTPPFRDADPSHLQLLLFSAGMATFEVGEKIIERGKAGGAGYLILSGQARMAEVYGQEAGRVIHVVAGQFIGELAMVADIPYRATVEARVASSAIEISHKLFTRVAREFPEFSAVVMRNLTGRLNATMAELNKARAVFNDARRFPQPS